MLEMVVVIIVLLVIGVSAYMFYSKKKEIDKTINEALNKPIGIKRHPPAQQDNETSTTSVNRINRIQRPKK